MAAPLPVVAPRIDDRVPDPQLVRVTLDYIGLGGIHGLLQRLRYKCGHQVSVRGGCLAFREVWGCRVRSRRRSRG